MAATTGKVFTVEEEELFGLTAEELAEGGLARVLVPVKEVTEREAYGAARAILIRERIIEGIVIAKTVALATRPGAFVVHFIVEH